MQGDDTLVERSGLHVRLSQRRPIPLDVELDCAPGEMLALVGPSGSGKSTVLRAIAGLTRVREGRIDCGGRLWLDTRERTDVSTRQRRVGFVFQHYGLFPHLTALANVMESLVDVPQPARRRRAMDRLASVHLEGLENRFPAELSGGQQQRVAVARALARDPDVLLLDEPFAAVDRGTRERLYVELAELRRELDIPVVLVTHDIDEALMLADRMTVLYHGRTLQSGVPFDVVSCPESVEVAQLVGLKNIFRAGVVAHDRTRGETIIEWRRQRLSTRLRADLVEGSQVTWAIPPGQIVLSGDASGSNTMEGAVLRYVKLGNNAALTVAIGDAERPPLSLSVPLHVANDRGITTGARIRVRLLREAIHLMAADDRAEDAPRKDRRIQPASDVTA